MADNYTDLHPTARKHLRRNFALGVLNGAAYRVADSMIDSSLVLTWFVSQLTGSSFIIGLIWPIRNGGWFLPQLLISGYAQRQERKLVLYRVFAVIRSVAMGLLAVATILWGGVRNDLLLVSFFLCLLVLSFGEGFSGVSFLDIVAKAIPASRRGGFFAWRNFTGGILALGSGAIVRYILDEQTGLAFPTNFIVLFLLAFVGVTISVIAFSAIVEPVEPVDSTVVGLREQLGRAIGFARQDRNFRRLILTRILLVFASGLATPFYIVYAKETLNAPASSVGSYLLSFTIATIISNFLWSRMSSRFGNRTVILVASVIGLGIPISAMAASYIGSLELFFLPFLLRGIYESSVMIGQVNFVLDIAPPAARPTYIGLINTVLGFTSFALALGGLIVDFAGYNTLFAITILCFILGFIAALGLQKANPNR